MAGVPWLTHPDVSCVYRAKSKLKSEPLHVQTFRISHERRSIKRNTEHEISRRTRQTTRLNDKKLEFYHEMRQSLK